MRAARIALAVLALSGSATAAPMGNVWALDGQVLGGSGCAVETYSEAGWTVESRVCQLLLHHPTPGGGPSLVTCRADRCIAGRCPAPAMPHQGKRRGPVERCAVAAEGGAVSVSGWIAGGELYVLRLEAQ